MGFLSVSSPHPGLYPDQQRMNVQRNHRLEAGQIGECSLEITQVRFHFRARSQIVFFPACSFGIDQIAQWVGCPQEFVSGL